MNLELNISVWCAQKTLQLHRISGISHMKRFLRYMPQFFFIGVAIVTILSLIPSTSVPPAFQFWDKAQHSLAFAVLTIMGCFAYPQKIKHVFIGLLIHGVAIEIMQGTLTKTRFGDVFDWLADGIGILFGVSMYLVIKKNKWSSIKQVQ